MFGGTQAGGDDQLNNFSKEIDQVRSNAIQMASSSQGQDHREESKKLELKMNFLKVLDSNEEDY